jgi:hypothetical protein
VTILAARIEHDDLWIRVQVPILPSLLLQP